MKQKYEKLKLQAVELDRTINEYGPIVEAFFKRAFPHDEENMLKHLKTLENLVPRADILYQDIIDKLLSGNYKIKSINKIDELPKVLSPMYANMIPKGWHAIANMYKLLYNYEASIRKETETKLQELEESKESKQPDPDSIPNIADAVCASDDEDQDYIGGLDLKAESAKIIKKDTIDAITEDDYMDLILEKYVREVTEYKRKGGKMDYSINFYTSIVANTPSDYVNGKYAEAVIFGKWIYIRHDHLERLLGMKFNDILPTDIIDRMAADGYIRKYLHDEKLTRRIAHVSHTIGPEEFYAIPINSIVKYVVKTKQRNK